MPIFSELIETVDTINGLRNSYEELIQEFILIIKKEKPSLILINGTYFVPWCLFQAGNSLGIPMILHYHGILTMETRHYPQKSQQIIKKLEQSFDNEKLLYIFPSNLAKDTVENVVFGHKISRSAIIPNSIPDHFFKIKKIGPKENLGFVGRWSEIKNPQFIIELSKKKKVEYGDYCLNIISDKKRVEQDVFNLDKVNIFEPMDSFSLANFYSKMGILLSPSFFETYGNVAQESIASGLPALIGPNMGITETFKELGLDDYIVKFDNIDKVLKKIDYLSGKPIDKKVRKMMKYNLTSAVINKKLISVFKSI